MPPSITRPPFPKRWPRASVLHGETVVDDYFWLREKSEPEVVAYLEAESAYADAVLAPLEPLREGLYREMLARIKETDLSVPYRKREYWYYARTEEGKQYPILCRKKGSLDADERIVLDLNVLARGHAYFAVNAFTVSDDGCLLAYSVDTTGYREYTLHVKDLASEGDLPFAVDRVSSVAWAADGRTLLYVVDDDAKRPFRLIRRRIDGSDERVVLEESDERFSLDVSRSRSEALLIVASQSHTTGEARILDAATPDAEPRLVLPREPEHEYDVDHGSEGLYIRTNDGGRNFRLVVAPVDDPGRRRWREVLPHRDAVMFEGFDVFARHLVVHEIEDGLDRLAVTDLATGRAHRVEFPEPAYAVFPDINAEFDASVYRFRYQSLVTPPTVYDYDLETRERKLLKRTEVLGGFDPSRYVIDRLQITAADGARVPVSLARRADVPRDGTAPLLLTGYGAYGYPLPVTFSSNRLSLLDRGVVVGLAHVRGGGEMGKRWHDEGRMLHKKNSFSDFVAVADGLVAGKWCARERLVVEGGSAGGLLVGAALNASPGFCGAALLRVPFLDVINTMLDPSLPLTVGEFEEWGDPRDPVQYAYMRSYCPYTNLRRADYPAILVKTSMNDSQVMVWEPAKWVAKLRSLGHGEAPLLLKVNFGAGHGGSSGRYDALRESAYDFAFLLWRMFGDRVPPAAAP